MPGADVKLDFTFTPTDNGLQDNFFFSLDDLPEEDFNIYKAPISYPYLKGYLPTVAKITVPALAHRQFSMHSPAKSFSIGGYEHFPLTEEQQANFNFTVWNGKKWLVRALEGTKIKNWDDLPEVMSGEFVF